jgi:hypothetical protein
MLMFRFVLVCGWGVTAALIALVWISSRPGRGLPAALGIGIAACLASIGALWFAAPSPEPAPVAAPTPWTQPTQALPAPPAPPAPAHGRSLKAFTPAAVTCKLDSPTHLGPNRSYEFTVVLDVPAAPGALVLNPLFYDAGWEWAYAGS